MGDHPHGRAGPATVRLGGAAPGADAHVAFRVELLVDGVEPAPFADFAGPYGDMDDVATTEFSLVAGRLAGDRRPSATVQVTAADGSVATVSLDPHQDGDPEGDFSIGLHSTEAEARSALAAGPPPYRFELTLTIDGLAHVATFTFPDDLNQTTSSFQPTFDPPLPGRGG